MPIEKVYAGGMRNVLAALPADIGRIIYISTTGVYGPAGGEWIDETTEPDPQRDGGRASLAAEQILAAHPLGRRGIILRLAGIYGPGRLPYLDQLRRSEPLAAPTGGYLNLIHVDDAAAAVLAAEQLPLDAGDRPRVFNVSDGNPVVRGEFYREVARQIAAEEPTFVEPEPGSPRAARAASDKRINNERMRRELRVRLSYPSYLEGLASALRNDNAH
jgi:nucleoside-diphosphate-sugar epimerase